MSLETTKLTIVKYLLSSSVMQVASTFRNQPWVCSVYFVADEEQNVYWLSLPSRRHSLEIEKNNKVAITMAIKIDQPIIGLGAEGTVDVVDDIAVVEKIMPAYIKKYDNGKDFLDRFKSGKNVHYLYRFKPSKYVLVDELNYPGRGSIDFLI